MSKVGNIYYKTLEGIRQESEEGYEFWLARNLQPILEYGAWDKFKTLIRKAMKACENSGIETPNHFSRLGKMVQIGSGAERYIEEYDYQLSRYACYLIVQNGDPTKPVIAYGQTYFALQTRRQELAIDRTFQELDENKKRLFLRYEMREHNKQLVEAASQAGVESTLDFAVFQNHGYKGLYGGLGAKEIHQKKGLKKNQQILDHMGSTELAANLFRATQTEEKLNRDNVQGKHNANRTHHEVGVKVRQAIVELGGAMPEEMPSPKLSVKSLEKQHKLNLETTHPDDDLPKPLNGIEHSRRNES